MLKPSRAPVRFRNQFRDLAPSAIGTENISRSATADGLEIFRSSSFTEPLKRGFAVAGTDDGHTTPGAVWAIGHPEKLVDFGYRAVHETAMQSARLCRRSTPSLPPAATWLGVPTAAVRRSWKRSGLPTTSTASSPAPRL